MKPHTSGMFFLQLTNVPVNCGASGGFRTLMQMSGLFFKKKITEMISATHMQGLPLHPALRKVERLQPAASRVVHAVQLLRYRMLFTVNGLINYLFTRITIVWEEFQTQLRGQPHTFFVA